MKTGIHAKLKWLRRSDIPSGPVAAAIVPETRPGWMNPMSAEILLASPLRQQLMRIIWQRTSLSGALFTELYRVPVRRFAELVQQLPASEYHHHSHPGGLLDHTLEVMAFAAKLRQRYLLPAGAAPEEQAREAEAWTAGVIYAALLHDVGKIATDILVTTDDEQLWYPWQGVLSKPYRLKYHKKRDHQLHPVVGGLLATHILPVTALNWLAQYQELYASFLYCINGHYDRAGILGELVQEADRASVAQFMGANASTALERPQPSLAKQMLTALRELAQTQFKLSNPHSGSDGWLTEDALWLISKTTADRVRAWLLQQGVTSVPDSNVRLFDEMQAHGLIIPTAEDKAVWSCEIIADGGWTPGCPLTLLRLSPSRLWETQEERPALFAGRVTPAVADIQTSHREKTVKSSEKQTKESDESLADLTFSLFASTVIDAIPEPDKIRDIIQVTEAPEFPVSLAPQPDIRSAILSDTAPDDITYSASGQGFIDWLRNGIQARKIMVNESRARIHMVDGKVFLVSPGVFKLYVQSTTGETGEQWKPVQKAFQRLSLHYYNNDGINIFTCEVKGPRKTRQVKGYLLDRPELIFGDAVPEDNPYLSVITTS
ncbi:relaxase [Klebsiella michiganensis]|uniref:MobH family relaxase n=1 Tax=Klebsiella michiganensis TaxID=1134687 RepID=UPI000E03861C|nr:MobH family relaxase [Klebsiella michiganensis]MBA8306164.1 TraI domain-containing protein [Klebsiella michiganensis]MBW5933800.1 relaxase [Klebsiella michiganensis]MBW5995205.1 relaxase [Klebsiella michiganensis]MBX4818550.1 relaxase [Klebsiella michiganensis]QLP35725.1 TraI domain-containing protein [Klebsiella michiganensis]